MDATQTDVLRSDQDNDSTKFRENNNPYVPTLTFCLQPVRGINKATKRVLAFLGIISRKLTDWDLKLSTAS